VKRLQLLLDLVLLAIVVTCGSLLLASVAKAVYRVLTEPILTP